MSHRRGRRERPRPLADLKAFYAAAAEQARQASTEVTARSVSGGVAVWMVGKTAVLLPDLQPGSPPEAYGWALNRVLTQAWGECPVCGEVAGVTSETASGTILADLRHEMDCPIIEVPEHLERWFDPRGADTIMAWAGATP